MSYSLSSQKTIKLKGIYSSANACVNEDFHQPSLTARSCNKISPISPADERCTTIAMRCGLKRGDRPLGSGRRGFNSHIIQLVKLFGELVNLACQTFNL